MTDIPADGVPRRPATEPAYLDESLAIAAYDRRRAAGTTAPRVPHALVRRMLGLDAR
jgi:hypothetical protein